MYFKKKWAGISGAGGDQDSINPELQAG